MTRSPFLKFLAAILFIGFSNTVSGQSLDEILSKHVTAMGGAENLSKFKSVKINAVMEVMTMEIPVTITIVHQKGFRSESTIQGMTLIQAVNGNSGWLVNPMGGQAKATALPEETAKSLSSQTDLTGLFNYKEKGYTATLEGQDTLEGAPVYKVGLDLKNGIKQIHYISKETFYDLKVTSSTMVNGQKVDSENNMSNYKQVNGITYPFDVEAEVSAMPGAKMIMKVKTLEVNPKVDEKIFAMPI